MLSAGTQAKIYLINGQLISGMVRTVTKEFMMVIEEDGTKHIIYSPKKNIISALIISDDIAEIKKTKLSNKIPAKKSVSEYHTKNVNKVQTLANLRIARAQKEQEAIAARLKTFEPTGNGLVEYVQPRFKK